MITLTFGIIIGILVSAPSSLRRRREIGDLKKIVRHIEKDLTTAREAAVVSTAPKAESRIPGDAPESEVVEETSEE